MMVKWGERGETDREANCELRYEDIYPLKKYPFGSISMLGPRNPKGFLDSCYNPWTPVFEKGKEQNDIRWDKVVHELNHNSAGVTITRPIDERDYKVAKPDAPLRNWELRWVRVENWTGEKNNNDNGPQQ
jgi:hypothetical protein